MTRIRFDRWAPVLLLLTVSCYLPGSPTIDDLTLSVTAEIGECAKDKADGIASNSSTSPARAQLRVRWFDSADVMLHELEILTESIPAEGAVDWSALPGRPIQVEVGSCTVEVLAVG